MAVEYSIVSATILLLPGDGIGVEIMRPVKKLLESFDFKIEEGLIGGAAIDAYGVPLAEQTLALAKKSDAVLLGAVGGPKWADLDFAARPEAGLLRIRKELGLYANLRPALTFEALIDASTLKPEIVRGLDIMIVRELTGGVYFGEPRGITDLGNGVRRGVNTQVYTTPEIQRVARIAFELAAKRNKKVCSVEKANVMESGKLWREDVTALHAKDYKEIELTHMYADNCAMQLLKNPKQFDVIVTDNLFGDVLSDEAAMLTGSLGMLPSASLGDIDHTGKRAALYEPIHGSAPDIAGKDIANPLAAILSVAMMMRYSFARESDATMIEIAVKKVLADGLRTADIMSPGNTQVSTTAMGGAVLGKLV